MSSLEVCNCPTCHQLGVSIASKEQIDTQKLPSEILSYHSKIEGLDNDINSLDLNNIKNISLLPKNKKSTFKKTFKKYKAKFIELKSFYISMALLLAPMLVALLIINFLPAMINNLESSIEPTAQANVESLEDFISFFNFCIAPAYFVFLLVLIVRKFNFVKRVIEAEKTRTTSSHNAVRVKHLAQLKNRYGEINYCDNCQSLYDQNKNQEPANEEGLKKLMEISPKSSN